MGGPFEMVAGWPLVSLFTLSVAASMAELASALPTSGSVYHWASELGGKSWGWFTAWLNIAGNLTVLAARRLRMCNVYHSADRTQATTRNLCSYTRNPPFACRSQSFWNPVGCLAQRFSVTVHIIGVMAIVGALASLCPATTCKLHVQSSDRQYAWLAVLVGLHHWTVQAQWTFTGTTLPQAYLRRQSIRGDARHGE